MHLLLLLLLLLLLHLHWRLMTQVLLGHGRLMLHNRLGGLHHVQRLRWHHPLLLLLLRLLLLLLRLVGLHHGGQLCLM